MRNQPQPPQGLLAAVDFETLKAMHTTMEPTSTSTAGGYAAYKLALAFGVPAAIAALVVMLLSWPATKREGFSALVCTVTSSLCGGAALIQHLELNHWAENTIGLIGMAGMIFAAGLPGWALVRAAFAYMERRKSKDLAELFNEAKGMLK